MRSVLSKIFVASCLMAPLVISTSCKKVSPIAIDNDEVIQTPYGLFIANTNGMLINTNDGQHFTNIFPPDGYAPRALVTSEQSLLMIKENLHASFNNGKNFQVVFDKVNRQEWNEQIIDAPLQGRMYVATTKGKGVAYSEDHGKTWIIDTNFDPLIPVNYMITSFAAANDGSVYAFSNISLLLLKRATKDAPWTPVTIEGVYPADDGEYFVTGDGQSLFLIESTGKFTHYVSDDGGVHWLRLSNANIPWGSKIWTATRTPGGNLLLGTENGVYRFEPPNLLVSSNNGMEIGTDVRRLTYKKNVYKNETTKYFTYAATNMGLFRSVDKGLNWERTTDTTFQHDYRAMY